MRKAIQRFFIEIGEAACYAIDIVKHSETVLGLEFSDATVLQQLVAGITGGFIHYSWDNPADNDNFTVLDAGAYLSRLTGQKWVCLKMDVGYVPQKGELVTVVWERSTISGVMRHFANPDYDPMGNARTVTHGKIVGYRIFRKA